MGYEQALLAKDVYEEKGKLEAQASKKDLYSGIGRGLGTLVALGITGGTAAPSAAALGAGLSDLVFGGIGSKWAGDIEKGKFFKGERKKLRKRFDPLGEESLVSAGSSALTAGLGQKLKMAEEIAEAKRFLPDDATADMLKAAEDEVRKRWKGKGLDFAGSAIGKTKVGQWLVGGVGPEPLTSKDVISDGIEPGAFRDAGKDKSLVTKRKLPELEPDARGAFDLQTMEDQEKAWLEELERQKKELERQEKVYWSGEFEE